MCSWYIVWVILVWRKTSLFGSPRGVIMLEIICEINLFTFLKHWDFIFTKTTLIRKKLTMWQLSRDRNQYICNGLWDKLEHYADHLCKNDFTIFCLWPRVWLWFPVMSNFILSSSHSITSINPEPAQLYLVEANLWV